MDPSQETVTNQQPSHMWQSEFFSRRYARDFCCWFAGSEFALSPCSLVKFNPNDKKSRKTKCSLFHWFRTPIIPHHLFYEWFGIVNIFLDQTSDVYNLLMVVNFWLRLFRLRSTILLQLFYLEWQLNKLFWAASQFVTQSDIRRAQ